MGSSNCCGGGRMVSLGTNRSGSGSLQTEVFKTEITSCGANETKNRNRALFVDFAVVPSEHRDCGRL